MQMQRTEPVNCKRRRKNWKIKSRYQKKRIVVIFIAISGLLTGKFLRIKIMETINRKKYVNI